MAVLVLDRRHQPLMPCSEKRARLLLERGRARVHRMVPFTIRLVDRLQADSVLQPLRLKRDPGSRITGIALVREKETGNASTGETVHPIPGMDGSWRWSVRSRNCAVPTKSRAALCACATRRTD